MPKAHWKRCCLCVFSSGQRWRASARRRGAANDSERAQFTSEQGLRVLALAWRSAQPDEGVNNLDQGLLFAGLVALEDPRRAEVPDAIRQCRVAGIRVIMVTGDNAHTASAIAREIGLIGTAEPTVITGDQLSQLSEIQLRLALDHEDLIFARVAADQKMRIVKALQAKRQIVAVTGDGVNDAPALKQANIVSRWGYPVPMSRVNLPT